MCFFIVERYYTKKGEVGKGKIDEGKDFIILTRGMSVGYRMLSKGRKFDGGKYIILL